MLFLDNTTLRVAPADTSAESVRATRSEHVKDPLTSEQVAALDAFVRSGKGLVLVHSALRAKPPRRTDVTDRRQFLHVAGLSAAAAAVYWTQRPVARLLGWRGGGRRFTGSYEAGSFAGNGENFRGPLARPLGQRAKSRLGTPTAG